TTVAAEVLVRWAHPQRGLVPPGEFISIAEEVGLIHRIDHRVLTLACEQLREWELHLPAEHVPSLTVNLSPYELREPDFESDLVDVLRESGIDPHHLVLELTESAMMTDPEATIEMLGRLREAGVRLA